MSAAKDAARLQLMKAALMRIAQGKPSTARELLGNAQTTSWRDRMLRNMVEADVVKVTRGGRGVARKFTISDAGIVNNLLHSEEALLSLMYPYLSADPDDLLGLSEASASSAAENANGNGAALADSAHNVAALASPNEATSPSSEEPTPTHPDLREIVENSLRLQMATAQMVAEYDKRLSSIDQKVSQLLKALTE